MQKVLEAQEPRLVSQEIGGQISRSWRRRVWALDLGS